MSRLTVLRELPYDGSGHYFVEAKCECGTVLRIRKDSPAKSCGCLQREVATKHGMENTRTYHSWEAMKRRCLNPRSDSYKKYGARGIKVCERWMDFQNFFKDMGERPLHTTLDRKNSNGHYEPDNCRWADIYTQNRNRSIHHGTGH